MLQDLRYLGKSSAQETDEDACDGNEDDGAGADEPVGFCRGIKDGGEFIHQRDDGYGKPGKPQPSRVMKGEQAPLSEQNDKKTGQKQIKQEQDDGFHLRPFRLSARGSIFFLNTPVIQARGKWMRSAEGPAMAEEGGIIANPERETRPFIG